MSGCPLPCPAPFTVAFCECRLARGLGVGSPLPCNERREDGSCEWEHLLGVQWSARAGCWGSGLNHCQVWFTPIIASESTKLTSLEREKKSLNSDKNINHRLPFLLEQQVPAQQNRTFEYPQGARSPRGKSFPSLWVTALRLGR